MTGLSLTLLTMVVITVGGIIITEMIIIEVDLSSVFMVIIKLL